MEPDDLFRLKSGDRMRDDLGRLWIFRHWASDGTVYMELSPTRGMLRKTFAFLAECTLETPMPGTEKNG